MTEQAHEFEEHEDIEAEAPDVDETPDVDAEPPQPEHDPDVIAEAKAFKWKAPDEWQGEKPAGYIEDPQEYLDRIKRSAIFREMNERLEKQEQASAEALRKIEAVNKYALDRQRQQYERELAQANARQRKAAEEGDMDAFDAATKYRDDLLKSAPTEPEPEPDRRQDNGPHPDIAAFMASDDGKWLHDPFLMSAGAEVIERSPGAKALPALEQAKFAEKQLRALYPERFPQEKETPKPQRQTVDSGGLAGGAAKRTAFSQLPQIAKDTFYRQVKDGTFSDTKEDREEYANVYNAT